MYSLDLNMLVVRFTRVNTILPAEHNDIRLGKIQKVLIISKMFGLVRLYDLTSISAIIQSYWEGTNAFCKPEVKGS